MRVQFEKFEETSQSLFDPSGVMASRTNRRKILESDEEEDNMENTPPSVRQMAKDSREARILPKKSAKAYQVAYDKFMTWFKKQEGVNKKE